MRKMHGLLTLIFLVSFTFNTNVYGQKIENKNGTRIVHNEKKGKWGGKPQIKLEYVRSIGDFDAEDENYLLYLPAGIVEDKAGNKYVLDSGNHRVQKFDKNGKFLATFGGEGQGPGEFRFAAAIAIDENENILVADRSNRRIEVFDTNGSLLKSFRPEARIDRGILLLGNEKYLTSNNTGMFFGDASKQPDALEPQYKIVDFAGKEYGKLGITEFVIDNNTTPGANSNSVAIDQEGFIYLSFDYLNRIEKYSQDGNLLLKIDRPLEFDVKIEKTTVERPSPGSVSVRGGERNNVSRAIAVDNKGRIWNVTHRRQQKKGEGISRSTTTSSDGQVSRKVSGNTDLTETDMFILEIFDTDGVLLGKIPINNFCDDITIYDDRLYIMDTWRGNQFHEYKIVES